jgi:anti-sigma regulatory factor (Ser/Thr protein kinase)
VNSSISLPVTPRAAATARQTIEAALGPHAHAELVENAKLLATELVTNAVRHAGLSPSEWIEFHVDATPSQVRVEVCDRGAGFRQR